MYYLDKAHRGSQSEYFSVATPSLLISWWLPTYSLWHVPTLIYMGAEVLWRELLTAPLWHRVAFSWHGSRSENPWALKADAGTAASPERTCSAEEKRAQMFPGFPHEWCMTYRVQPMCCSGQPPASDTALQGDYWYFLPKYCLGFTKHFLLNCTIYIKFNTKSLPSVKFIFLLWIVTAATQPVCSDCKCVVCCCCTVVHIGEVMS